MFTEILNSFIRTRPMIKNSDGKWVDKQEKKEVIKVVRSSGDIGDNGTLLFSVENKKIIIDSFQLATNTRHNIFPRLHSSTIDSGRYGSNLFVAVGSYPSFWDLNANYLSQGDSSYLELTENSTSDSRYKMVSRAPIILPNGGKLGIYAGGNYDPTRDEYRCHVVYREIEVI